MKDVGGGDERQVNKSAICSVFASRPRSQSGSVIGLLNIGEGWAPIPARPPTLDDTGVFAE